jgi:hypothetical protein
VLHSACEVVRCFEVLVNVKKNLQAELEKESMSKRTGPLQWQRCEGKHEGVNCGRLSWLECYIIVGFYKIEAGQKDAARLRPLKLNAFLIERHVRRYPFLTIDPRRGHCHFECFQ